MGVYNRKEPLVIDEDVEQIEPVCGATVMMSGFDYVCGRPQDHRHGHYDLQRRAAWAQAINGRSRVTTLTTTEVL